MEKRIRETNASERRRSLGGCACALHRGRSVLTNLYANPVRLTSPRLTCCVQKPLYFLRSRQSLVAASFTPCTIDSSIILGWGRRERGREVESSSRDWTNLIPKVRNYAPTPRNFFHPCRKLPFSRYINWSRQLGRVSSKYKPVTRE